MKLKSRFCSISVPNGEPLDLFPYVPKVEPPVFNSLYDYLSFDLKGYKREFDGEAEFDEDGNLLNDIDESVPDSQDSFDEIDNTVDSLLNFVSKRDDKDIDVPDDKDTDVPDDNDTDVPDVKDTIES